MAIQMDLEKTSSGQRPAKYWKACQDNYCRQHLEENGTDNGSLGQKQWSCIEHSINNRQ